ncbi:RagB/SusD family nutrient uptake outer membrane protein [Chondrinema litorale]|uniref:RagB/SusD family nutrient uptake outer membrane protein n=1 Tax=Chondrinema litorale TaxID=2994555 RepID=UPI002542E70B|nr:RagB/SusD family nutrient uptake outer membrane protein [Chondrinema litorale]UZR97538.1 RagB/SusD family nutrient uptake outer membrane protein [Chondrinema litorale]
MKFIYIKYFVVVTLLAQILGACSDDYLEVEPKGRSLEENYYRNEDEAYNGLVAVYDVVGWVGGGYVTKITATISASDNHYAGGGSATDVTSLQVWNDYSLDPANGPQGELWTKGYSGVFRANILLSKLPDVDMDESLKNRFTAESRFLRAYFYFDLIRFFKNIPLLTEPVEPSNFYTVEQNSREEVYAAIEEDLLAAIPNLPEDIDLSTEAGRATKGAAIALLGKVYLQQEKFSQAVEQLAKVNGTTPGAASELGGYALLANYGDLWTTSNKFNTESIFEINKTSSSNAVWDCIGCTEGNIISIMSNPRDYAANTADAPQIVSGWSFYPITQNLVNAFESGDERYPYTVLNIDSLANAGVVNYTPGYMNTGYFLAKYAGTIADQSTGGGNMELNFPKNLYEIRLADTYLLEAEALVRGGGNQARAQALLDAIRERAGLASVPANIENIIHERRVELASEGHRWFDLIRNGLATQYLGEFGFVEGKHEYLPIPLLELTNTELQQDPAY